MALSSHCVRLPLLRLLPLLFVAVRVVQAQDMDSTVPSLAWTVALKESNETSFVRGNGVLFVEPNTVNDALLAITTHQGSLVLLNATSSTLLSVVSPPNPNDAILSCNGTAIVIPRGTLPLRQRILQSQSDKTEEDETETEIVETEPPDDALDAEISATEPPVDETDANAEGPLIVYAVASTPLDTGIPLTSTTLWAVSAVGEVVWNVTVNGVIQGSPVFSSHLNVLYVVHNVPRDSVEAPILDTSTLIVPTQAGQVSIFQLDSDPLIPPTRIALLPTESTGRPFGPPSNLLVTLDTSNERDENEAVTMDVLLVSDATPNDNFGALFSLTGAFTEDTTMPDFAWTIGSTGIRPSMTAPVVFSKEGSTAVFLGQESSTVVAWINGDADKLWQADLVQAEQQSDDETSFWGRPTWGFDVQTNADTPLAALPVSPVVSTDGRHLFLASAGTEVSSFALDTAAGTGWVATDATSPVVARPVLSGTNGTNANDAVIYFVDSSGTVRQYNAETGVMMWNLDCGAPSCPNVEADFTLSPDGSMLYYGDVDGNLYAIQVAETSRWMLPPTLAPSNEPSTRPTRAPTVRAAVAPNRTVAPVRAPLRAPRTVAAPTRAPRTARPTEPALTTFPTAQEDRSVGVSGAATSTSPNVWPGSMLIYLLAAICGALLILIGIIFIVMRKQTKRRNRRKLKRQDRALTVSRANSSGGSVGGIMDVTTPKSSQSMGKETYSLSTHSRTTPMTLPCIAESPDDEEQASVGFEVGMDKSVVESEPDAAVRDLDDMLAAVADVEQGTSMVPGHSHLDMDDESTHSGTQSDGPSVDSDGSASFLTRGILAVASAVGVMASLSHADEKKDDDIVSKAAADAEMSCTNRLVISPAASRDRSGDKSVSSRMSSGTAQILAQSPSGEQLIAWRSESVEQLTESTKDISRFTATTEQPVSPLPSPTILYGVAKKNVNLSSPKWTSSPTGSILSLDESLYMDEHTVMSLEMPLNESLGVKSAKVVNAATELVAETLPVTVAETLPVTVADLPSDCPEDEAHSKLQPGASYLNRHQAKKEQAQSENSTVAQPLVHSEPHRTSLPMYKGVSVRPASRSRAGIFSRRQPKAMLGDISGEDSQDDIDCVPKSSNRLIAGASPEVTPEPVKRANLSPGLVVPSAPTVTPQRPTTPTKKLSGMSSQAPPSPVSPPRFTSAGFYVEEPKEDITDESIMHSVDESNISVDSSVHKHLDQPNTTYDPWGSFLSELSKVESQFFNPTTASKSKPKSRSLGKGQPPALPAAPDDVDSDNEAPPPAPRTFYA